MPNVQVAVRCRPPLPHEASVPCKRIECNEISNTVSIQTTDNSAKTFAFDKILPESASQEDVFDYVSPMVDHALDGLHATIFAYGQTGSGKTFTMEGLEYVADGSGKMKPNLNTPLSKHGVLPRVIEAIFQRANERMSHNPSIQYKIKCSFMQLYNECVSDLLNPSRRNTKEGLRIRWTRNDQFAVENLYVFECENPDQMREMFQVGVREKVMGSHHMNIQSSRSHCLFTIYVVSWDPATPDCQIKSELTLVDLAGSEKLALLAHNPSAQLLKESIEINTSLLSLGKVITALATNAKSHVPYRDSKLTKLLKHALGGNAMTLMIACINPLDAYVEESLSTLLYAGRARNITNTPHVNEDPRAALIRQLREEIMSLKTELEYYRQMALNGVADPNAVAQMERLQGGGGGGGRRPATQETRVANGVAGSSGRPASEPTRDQLDVASNSDPYQLAEKLIESCTMLKNLMTVNGQLRAAFDKVSEMRAESERREVELNAENASLRERIEMLESIALNTDSDGEVTGSAASLAGSGTIAAGSLGADGPTRRGTSSSGRAGGSGPAAGGVRSSSQTTRSSRDISGGLGGTGTYVDKLSAYNSKYRNPTKGPNYEEYYAVARRPVAQRASASSQIVQEIERLTRNIPRATAEMIPTSLQTTASFGSLAFGGTEDDRNALEERRRQRQLRMQQLQEQHNTMQRGFSGFLPSGPVASVTAAAAAAAAVAVPPASITMQAFNRGGAGTPTDPQFAAMLSGPTAGNGSGRRPSSSSGAGGSASHTGRLFQYLSQEESRQTFTEEQLRMLQRRSGGSGANASAAAAPPAAPSNGRRTLSGTNGAQPFARQDAILQQQQFQQQLYEAQQALMNHRR